MCNSCGWHWKKILLKDFPKQARGGKGVQIEVGNSYIAGAAFVSDEDNILISGVTSSICIPATEIHLLGRTSVGNILMKGGKVLSITKI